MPSPNAYRWLAILLLAVAGAGCAHCRLPAIDPTGQRIFTSSTTAINSPADCPLIPKCPVPAWKAPATPPPCGSAPLAAANLTPVAPATLPVAEAGCPDLAIPHLTVTPNRFVAPVGSDVVLVAGMCSDKGHYVMRQPLEWIVAPEGVGYIVEVGQEDCPLHKLCSTKKTPFKLNPTYALAHTSTVRQVITRGTGRAEDDLELGKGQSWISVSSPNEGMSYVTVLAPKEGNWEQRKQTATIYWVDAKWSFPAPVVVRPSEKHRLTTKIVRSNGLPVANWLVRYDILDGPPAAFGVANEQSIEIRTDINGEASVELLPQTKDAGISQLRVQIIRPDPEKPGEPPMLVGQGFTQVQWSTPGLLVRGEATQRTGPDGRINYRLEVVNNGDQLTRDVVLSFSPPQGVAITGSNPQAQTFGQRLEWRLGNLSPGASQIVAIIGQASLPGNFKSCFTARSAEGLETPPTCFDTDVAGNALRIDVQEPPMRDVTVGDEVQYRITVTNTSNAVIPNVRARDTFEAGLQQIEGEVSPIERVIGTNGNLQPNETQRFALTFRVTQPGENCHRLDITADNGQSFSQRYCVRAAAPAVPVVPQVGILRLQMIAKSPQAREGEPIDFTIEAVNDGAAPLTNLRLDMIPSKGLRVERASEFYEQTQIGFFWKIPRLEPGQKASRELTCITEQAGAVGVKGEGIADGIEAKSSDAVSNILPGAAAEPGPINPNPRPANPAGAGAITKPAGDLKISINSSANPIPVGREIVFTVNIVNQGEGPDQNVSVRMKFPKGLTFESVPEAPTAVTSVGGKGEGVQDVELAPIREIRAGEKLSPCKFLVKGTVPSDEYVVQVQVFSASHPEGITKDTQVRVFAGR